MFPKTRICITTSCNLSCEYCPPSGDSYRGMRCPIGRPLSEDEYVRLLSALAGEGCKFIQFTGGEPLLEVRKIRRVAKSVRGLESVNLGVTTNGCLLTKQLDLLRELPLSYLMVSLDTLQRERFIRITGVDVLTDVIEGIHRAKEIVKVRLNCVITNRNKDEVWNLIEFCVTEGIDIKLIDLNYYRHPGEAYWNQNYYDLTPIMCNLMKASFSHSPAWNFAGKTGIPMINFCYKGITITVKNSKAGSHYARVCSNCHLHPATAVTHYCQEGLYDMYITADGLLQICKHRKDMSVDLQPYILRPRDLAERIRQYAQQYNDLHFVPGKLDTSWLLPLAIPE